MNHTLVKSSNIRSIGYNKHEKTLEICFNSGKIYQYHGPNGFPEELYDALMLADSKGKFANQFIYPQYVGLYVRDDDSPEDIYWTNQRIDAEEFAQKKKRIS
jgi:hypothetical protein